MDAKQAEEYYHFNTNIRRVNGGHDTLFKLDINSVYLSGEVSATRKGLERHIKTCQKALEQR